MATRSFKWLKSNILLVVHSGTGVPLAIRINVRKITTLTVLLSLIFLSSITGSLLFFREMELNRKLSKRVLELEITEQLSRLAARVESAILPAATVVTPALPKVEAKKVEPVPSPVPAVPASKPTLSQATSALVTPAAPEAVPAAKAGARARIADLSVDCEGQNCGVKLALVPTVAGPAQGYLLLILETEVPRIGAATSKSEARKRYFVYPGNFTRDELNTEDINALEGKSFKFSRMLQTTVDFTLTNLLRPLAINVYLYDSSKNLVHHERKPIDLAVE